jgi:hypothetical protein
LVSSKPTGEPAAPRSFRKSALLPDPHLGRDLEALLDRRLLEERRDDDRLAFNGNHGCRQPLRAPPLDPGEIVEARAGLDDHRADPILLHQHACFGEPLKPFVGPDRRR